MMFGGTPEYWRRLQQQMTPQEEPEPETVEFDDVTAWRFGFLCGIGFDPESALRMAEDKAVDLHEAEAMVKRGCPHVIAVRILL